MLAHLVRASRSTKSLQPTCRFIHHLSERVPDFSTIKGMTFTAEHTFTPMDVETFCNLTGDLNPIHSNPAIAAKRGFDGAIMPGMLTASMFPAIIAWHFPGMVYIKQDLEFKAPALVGEEVTANVTITSIKRQMVAFDTVCTKRGGDGQPVVVIQGKALGQIWEQ